MLPLVSKSKFDLPSIIFVKFHISLITSRLQAHQCRQQQFDYQLLSDF